MLSTAFQEWAEPWSRLGLYLTLWDERCDLTEQSGDAAAFWSTLIQHSKHCWRRLRQVARAASDGETLIEPLDADGFAWCMAVPLTYRERIVGAVVGMGLSRESADQEKFVRFCSVNALDHLVFERLSAGIQRHDEQTLRLYAQILGEQIEALAESTLARRDINDLSSQLAQSYEELNLIYRVSSGLSVARHPAEHLEDMCRDLIGATVVESFVAVLEPDPQLGEPIQVRVGELHASREDVLRLYRQARDAPDAHAGPLIVNKGCTDPAYAWASSWLQRFVFFRLTRGEHDFGGILAINRRDREPFGSVEIQLINAVSERTSAFLENARLYSDLEQLFMGMLHALVSSIDAKDTYTRGHSQRVAWLSRRIAGLSGATEATCQRVYLSGLLHDIGKLGVSEAVLRKTGRLTREEFNEMKLHPEIGARILEGVPQVADLIPGVLHHHERIDGKGYPSGLAGEDVPWLGRVIGLADSFDAMTTKRTYRGAQPVQIALAEIRRCAGTQFDPHLAELLLADDIERSVQAMDQLSQSGVGQAGMTSKGGRES